ncbi:MAG TPA: holo-ACP synthase [Anaerohalosphaeraceae bacterium]|mgnify:FL=1|nr:holo-ACP synthase [Anaerohalosphaeraceae bacterium]HOL88085.1 holo-ACP synthase [Anaerohalosphaeraceae bacterium]HPP55333.1 holo-ACP synthase [Anaerohalosphaeraceae bacterium]
MKILAHGIDLVEFGRLEQLLQRHGARAMERIFTAKEQADAQGLRNHLERLAGRFAAKEAVMKLVGSGWRDGVAWTDVEVVNDVAGRPVVNLTGRLKELAEKQGIEQITLSITHTDRFAIASAVALAEAKPS